MSIEHSDLRLRVDAALDDIEAERATVLRRPPSPDRSDRLAELYEQEAGCWQILFDQAKSRPYWRALLISEVSARRAARYWRHRAFTETQRWPAATLCPGRSVTARAETDLFGIAS